MYKRQAVAKKQEPAAFIPDKNVREPTAIEWFRQGYSAALAGNHQEAIDAYDKCLELNPKFAEAYYVRGNAYINLGDTNRALQDLDKAIALNKDLASAYYARGLAYNKLGNSEQALENYKMSAKLGFKTAQDYLKSQKIVW